MSFDFEAFGRYVAFVGAGLACIGGIGAALWWIGTRIRSEAVTTIVVVLTLAVLVGGVAVGLM